MKMLIYTIHSPIPDNLDEVIGKMKTLGSQTIRVVDCGDYLVAIEGCHRIEAARIFSKKDLRGSVSCAIIIMDAGDWPRANNQPERARRPN